MKLLALFTALTLTIMSSIAQEKGVYAFSAKNIDGAETPLSNYKGKVLLIVNTASKCGFTPQYKDLQALYEKYHEKGLEILGFPCNQFAGQEPGTAEEIFAFCSTSYGVTFPMFEKIDVNGDDTHPLYKYLKAESPGVLGTEAIKWNFTKFLITPEGAVYNRYSSATLPEDIEPEIVKLLGL